MTTNPPLTPAAEIEVMVDRLGMTHEEAARMVAARNLRKKTLSESRDPVLLLPEIKAQLRLRAEIDRIVKTVSTPIHYRIETDCGPVHLGQANRWATRPGDFSAAFLDIGEMPILPRDRDRRNELCSMIARAAEPEDIGDEATESGHARAILRSYLEFRPLGQDREDAIASGYPWWHEGRIAVLSEAIDQHARLTFQLRPRRGEMGRMLRAAGCEPLRPHTKTHDGKDTTRSAWLLPEGGLDLGADDE